VPKIQNETKKDKRGKKEGPAGKLFQNKRTMEALKEIPTNGRPNALQDRVPRRGKNL